MEFKDYYKTLGVAPDASQDEIRKSYRRLARKYHPDVSAEADAEERFKEVGEAYEVLRDPEKRKGYDQLRTGGFREGESFRPPPGWSGDFDRAGPGGVHFSEDSAGGFSDFFESLFGQGRRADGGRPSRGRDIHARVAIDLESAYAGGVKRVELEQPEVAPDGQLVRNRRALDIRIPPGVTDGRQLRLRGKGGGGTGGPPGDLYLEVQVLPHPRFELHGRDVHVTLPIAPWEAVLGGQVAVPTLGGPVTMSVPAGAASGQRLRLKGKGMPGPTPGDQYVTLKIVMPPVRDDRDRKLFETMREQMKFNPRSEWETET